MASVGFRWLDILEKEFDKAFVDLDLTIGELESEEPDVVFNVRQKLCTLSSCFAQLTHKSQTIFQNSAKIEAELIHMRAELVESKAKRELLEQELHGILLQLHSSQLSQLRENFTWRHDAQKTPDVNSIKKKLEAELRLSPIHNYKNKKESPEESLKFSPVLLEVAQIKAENSQLRDENSNLRSTILSLNSEVYGAKLAAKYLDKELAGRIQQLQLLGREMRGDIRDKLWRQLESEILLQRHKTVVRACRRNSVLNNQDKGCKPQLESLTEPTQHFGDIRTVVVKRKLGQGLGISITGGREHGVPILISELEPNGPAADSQQLYIGDAILSVNDRDLRQACHREAVDILQQQTGDCTFQVQYIAADDSDNSLEEDGYNYRFFDEEVGGSCNSRNLNPPDSVDLLNTPTAPRTPESSVSRIHSRDNLQLTPTCNGLGSTVTVIYAQDSDDVFDNCNINQTNGNIVEIIPRSETPMKTAADKYNCNEQLTQLVESTDLITTDRTKFNTETTTDIVLIDNSHNHIIKLENYKKVDRLSSNDDNFNCSLNSLNSENLSSPMQTSADVFLDSELLSTDVASNDSESPKNLQAATIKAFTFRNDVKNFSDEYTKQEKYESTDSLPKSDQSLLNSEDSSDSSPVHKMNRDYKKPQRKHKKRYFGVKTLQSIFNKHGGYSDISSTASDLADELLDLKNKKPDENDIDAIDKEDPEAAVYTCTETYPDTTPQFEENIHNILSEIFMKNFAPLAEPNLPNLALNKPTGSKKYFSLHGQHLRVGKALRLCPNEEYSEQFDQEQRKEKLLARYVYNANSLAADGVGDPDFGTPV